jgi:hypothetical protein
VSSGEARGGWRRVGSGQAAEMRCRSRRSTAFAQLRVPLTSPLPALSLRHPACLDFPSRPFSGPPYALPWLRLSRPRSPSHPPPSATSMPLPLCHHHPSAPPLTLGFPATAASRCLARTCCRRPPVALATPPWACIVCATIRDARVPTVRVMHAPRLTSLTSTSSLSPVSEPVRGLVIGPGLVHATTKSIASSFRPGLVHAH